MTQDGFFFNFFIIIQWNVSERTFLNSEHGSSITDKYSLWNNGRRHVFVVVQWKHLWMPFRLLLDDCDYYTFPIIAKNYTTRTLRWRLIISYVGLNLQTCVRIFRFYFILAPSPSKSDIFFPQPGADDTIWFHRIFLFVRVQDTHHIHISPRWFP